MDMLSLLAVLMTVTSTYAHFNMYLNDTETWRLLGKTLVVLLFSFDGWILFQSFSMYNISDFLRIAQDIRCCVFYY